MSFTYEKDKIKTVLLSLQGDLRERKNKRWHAKLRVCHVLTEMLVPLLLVCLCRIRRVPTVCVLWMLPREALSISLEEEEGGLIGARKHLAPQFSSKILSL